MMALTSSQDTLSWVVGRLPLVTSVLIIVLIGHSLATLTWQILAPPPEPEIGILRDKSASITRKTVNRTRYDRQIAQLHLFGSAPKK